MGKIYYMMGKSSSGKDTIYKELLERMPMLGTLILYTTRPKRDGEQNGVEYFFLTPDEFRSRIEAGEFLEYEEVYTDRFYGTLKSQVEHQCDEGQNVVFDVDVKGGCNIKQHYGDRALSIFIMPPSVAELRRRLESRATDAPEVIDQRIARAEFEISFADKFDKVVVNDDLEKAKKEVLGIIKEFLIPNS